MQTSFQKFRGGLFPIVPIDSDVVYIERKEDSVEFVNKIHRTIQNTY
jgi:hypothetical protein